MNTHLKTHSFKWLLIGGSLFSAVVAFVAEGPFSYTVFLLLGVCVAVICCWGLTGKPSLYWCVAVVFVALLSLGWSVGEPVSAMFQAVMICAAVGWRIERLSHSLLLLLPLMLISLLVSVGSMADGDWWNWSVGCLIVWSLGRVIQLLEQTMHELTEARSQLINSAAKEERLRISRDVHDMVGHSLTAMLLNIRAAQRALSTDSKEAALALADAEKIGSVGMKDIRTVLVAIHTDPQMVVDDSEALSSIPDSESVVRLLARQEHISVSTSGDVASLPGPLALAIYRILQECITNISKHSAENTASIVLHINKDEVHLTSRMR